MEKKKTIKQVMKAALGWLAKHNEFSFVAGFIVLIWMVVPFLFNIVDPQAGEFSIEILYVPLIAAIYFFIGLLVVWAYIKLVFPKGFMILDNLFQETEKLSSWEKSELLLRLFGWLVVLYAISLLAVTGISAIM